MAGRGARGNTSINLQALGIGRGEALPPTAREPPPLFPPLTARPAPLQTGLDAEYMLALKQELRAAHKNLLHFYVRRAEPRKDVERYRDKYQSRDNAMGWSPDWSRLPKELRVRRARTKAPAGPSGVKALEKSIMAKEEEEAVLSKLETQEKKEEMENSADEEEHAEEEEELELEDDEELEEETDYIMSYFDNGEDNESDNESNMDEATY